MKKEIKIEDGTNYIIDVITLDQADKTFMDKSQAVTKQNRGLVAACLNNGDGGERTAESLGSLPFHHYSVLLAECLELNGLVAKANSSGEPKAGV